jgi:hypothetical protein
MNPPNKGLISEVPVSARPVLRAVTIGYDLRFSQTSQFVISITNGRDVGHLP